MYIYLCIYINKILPFYDEIVFFSCVSLNIGFTSQIKLCIELLKMLGGHVKFSEFFSRLYC